MGKAISYDQRLKVVERCEEGEDHEVIATSLQVSISFVKKLWRKYKKEGKSALQSNYNNCGVKSTYSSEIREAVQKLRDHKQGGNYIHSKLRLTYSDQGVPSARTLQRWWVKEGTNRLKGRVTKSEKKSGANEHMKSGK